MTGFDMRSCDFIADTDSWLCSEEYWDEEAEEMVCPDSHYCDLSDNCHPTIYPALTDAAQRYLEAVLSETNTSSPFYYGPGVSVWPGDWDYDDPDRYERPSLEFDSGYGIEPIQAFLDHAESLGLRVW